MVCPFHNEELQSPARAEPSAAATPIPSFLPHSAASHRHRGRTAEVARLEAASRQAGKGAPRQTHSAAECEGEQGVFNSAVTSRLLLCCSKAGVVIAQHTQACCCVHSGKGCVGTPQSVSLLSSCSPRLACCLLPAMLLVIFKGEGRENMRKLHWDSERLSRYHLLEAKEETLVPSLQLGQL